MTHVLVLNCGSSSVKCAVIDPTSETTLLQGLAEGLSAEHPQLTLKHNGQKTEIPLSSSDSDYATVLKIIIDHLKDIGLLEDIQAIGHRVVHGGEHFKAPTRINDHVIQTIEACIDLAPLHNPANLEGIKAAQSVFPNLPHVAVFDTAFHQTLPQEAYLYALPYDYYKTHHIRRYGFHGISHAYVSQKAAELLKHDINVSAFITAHLGNGCSISAIKNGKSVDTSMGFTPLEGLIMGTRSGDLDPSIIQYLHAHTEMSVDDIITTLNKKSGLLGISGKSMDMRILTEAHEKGDAGATLAIDMFCYRLAKYIASYFVPLGKCDALIFTGGIGENAILIREKVLTHLKALQFICDTNLNQTHGQANRGIITTDASRIAMVVPTNEELLIAQSAV